jgi:predicted transglutaminase-like cysteine proteinase
LRANGAVEGGAGGFIVGDKVIVALKGETTYVVGHILGRRNCNQSDGNYYFFFEKTPGEYAIARANSSAGGITILEQMWGRQIGSYSATIPATTLYPEQLRHVFFHLKKFSHNVAGTTQDLYFVFTSLYIDPNPFPGWVAFAVANPYHPLVTNNDNTCLPLTSQLIADMTEVNYTVNHGCSYIKESGGSDNWRIMNPGESGDCEDFALTKAQLLLDKGYPASALHIECGVLLGYGDPAPPFPTGFGAGEETELHAWLVVQTEGTDYALDLNSDAVQINSALAVPAEWGDRVPCARRRQIGSNWAFISSFGWMFDSIVQPFGNGCYYILDPLLNIFYILDPLNMVPYPHADVKSGTSMNSPTSVNFSATDIYWAMGNQVRTYRLGKNVLELVSTATFTNENTGFVENSGDLPSLGVFGYQDITTGVHIESISYNDVYHLSAIDPSARGLRRHLADAEVISENGYYRYIYRYHTIDYIDQGTLVSIMTTECDTTEEEGEPIEEIYMMTTWPPLVSEPKIERLRKTLLGQTGRTSSPYSILYQWETNTHWPVTWHRPHTLFTSTIKIYGEEFEAFPIEEQLPNFEENPVWPYRWINIEIPDREIINGILLWLEPQSGLTYTNTEPVDKRRIYHNGTPWIDTIATALDVTPQAIMGMAYIPQTDRLN